MVENITTVSRLTKSMKRLITGHSGIHMTGQKFGRYRPSTDTFGRSRGLIFLIAHFLLLLINPLRGFRVKKKSGEN